MTARKTSGLTEQDCLDAKVFLRTFNDALCCAQSIAERESARAQYKEYVKSMLQSSRENQLIVDSKGDMISGGNAQAVHVYRVMKHTQKVAIRYGLNSCKVDSKKELVQRLDRAIAGLNTEIALKKEEVRQVIDNCNEKFDDKITYDKLI